jgi:hypothetical protein
VGGLSGLKRGFDDAGDADGDPVLKLEDIFERAVETIGSEMRAVACVEQLRSDAHATTRLADRAL